MITVAGMLSHEFPMMPLGQRMAPTVAEEAPGLQCAGHLVLWEDTSWRDPRTAVEFLAPHSRSIRQGGLG